MARERGREVGVRHVHPRGIGVRRAPTALGLEHVAPEHHLTEDAADRAGVVAAAHVRQCVDRVACGVEAAVALRARHGMRAERCRKRIVLEAALRKCGTAVRPDELVEHRAETRAVRRLGDDPGAPPGDRAAALTKRASGFHQLVLARRVSAGWITSSTSPYATASPGVMNRSRSMSFMTCSSGCPECREMI